MANQKYESLLTGTQIAGGACIAVSFSVANLLSPQTFRDKDRPHYLPAKICLVVVMAASILVTGLLRLVYEHRNSEADRLNEPALSRPERNSVLRAGPVLDFADREFRYAT